MFCSKCGAANAMDAAYCASCGAPLTQQNQPQAPQVATAGSPQLDPRAAGPYGSPGTGALWLSIFGFVCGIPALLGIIFGVGARREAKQRGKSPAKANWAIAIGVIWLVPVAITALALTQGGSDGESSQTDTSQAAEQDPLPADAPQESEQGDEQPDLDALRSDLVGEGFTCDREPGGEVGLIQCRKGTMDDPVYGEVPIQLVNIRMAAGTLDGFAKPKTLKLLREYLAVSDDGDDGTGTNTRFFSSD